MKNNGTVIYCYGDDVRVMISSDGIVLASCGLSSLICYDPARTYESEITFRGITVEELSGILHEYGNIHVAESFDEVVLEERKKSNILQRIFRNRR